MALPSIASFFATILSMIGVVLLFIEVDRNHKFARFMPMVQVFRKHLEIERNKFSDPADYLRPHVRGERFNDDIFEKTLKTFGMKTSPPAWMKKEIIDFAYLLVRSPDNWEKKIEENQTFMTGLRITRNADLLRWGVGLLLFSGALQLLGLCLSMVSGEGTGL